MKAHEELLALGIERCEECHCAVGSDWEYDDFSNKTITTCPQCGTKIYLESEEDNEASEELTLKLTLVVSYKLHGMAADDMRIQLESMVDHAIGNGLLSGNSPAETTSYTGHVECVTENEYEVGVSRSYSHKGSVVVKARSPEEAQDKAMEEIDDTELKLDQLVLGTDEILYIEVVE
jgi:predicted  nucleic acid-binding Zn-ribbon protein